MIVKVNGENITLEKSLNVNEFLLAVKAEQPEYVTVQLNGEFVEREDFSKIFVKDGDEVEMDGSTGIIKVINNG